jgi:hypothetical protein
MTEQKFNEIGTPFGEQLDSILNNMFEHILYLESFVNKIKSLSEVIDKLKEIDFEAIQKIIDDDIETKSILTRIQDDVDYLHEQHSNLNKRQIMDRRSIEEMQAAVGSMMMQDTQIDEALETINKLKQIFGGSREEDITF